MKFKEFKIRIPAEIGHLEGQICEGDGTHDTGIVVCHPHPTYGGTMANNVVRAVYKELANNGYVSLRFNFRGIGTSDGEYTNGEGERNDVLSSIRYLLENYPTIKNVCIVGYSFGAAIGCSVINEMDEIKGYIAISYPFTFIPTFIDDSYSDKYKIFIIGDKDDFTTIAAFETQMKNYSQPMEYHIIPDADHFWAGKEEIIASITVRSVKKWIY